MLWHMFNEELNTTNDGVFLISVAWHSFIYPFLLDFCRDILIDRRRSVEISKSKLRTLTDGGRASLPFVILTNYGATRGSLRVNKTDRSLFAHALSRTRHAATEISQVGPARSYPYPSQILPIVSVHLILIYKSLLIFENMIHLGFKVANM